MFEFILKSVGILAIFQATFFVSTHGQQTCVARVSTCSSNGICPVEDTTFSMPGVGVLQAAQYFPGQYAVIYACSFLSSGITVQAPGCIDVTIYSLTSFTPINLACNRACANRAILAVDITSSCQKNITGLGVAIGSNTQNTAFLDSDTVYIESNKLPANITVYQPDHATLDLTLTSSTSMIELQCKVDGGWGAWVNGSCNQPCGPGSLVRTRPCDTPAPANDGIPCVGNSMETVTCNTAPCPGWGAWTEGPCSKTCGAGTRTKSRLCNQPAPATLDQTCVGDWLEWTGCSCNAPQAQAPARRRTRPCNEIVPSLGAAPCNPDDLIGYESCSLTYDCVFCSTACCNGSSYHLFDTINSILPFQTECFTLGGKVLEVGCQEELDLIEQMITDSGYTDDTWLGLVTVNGQILYLSNREPIAFQGTWFTGEPTLGDDCYEIRGPDKGFAWRSDSCNNSEQFICEFN